MKNNFQIFKSSSIVLALMLLFAVNIHAQVDRTKPPTPGAAPVIKIGTPAKFTLPNGLKLIVVQNSKLPSVSATLSFDIDPILEGNKAGYVDMAGELIGEGSKTKKKEVLDEEIDFLGASFNTSSSSASVNALSSNFNKAFSLMADVVLNPAFAQADFDRIKKQTLTGIEAEKDEPNTISDHVSSKLMYGAKHPYGEFRTETTVKNITLSDVKKYYTTYWKPNIAYLVFVGDITPANAQKLALQCFGKWQRGIVPKNMYVAPKPMGKTIIAIVDRPSAVQSNINIVSAITLKQGTPDVIPANVMNTILGSGDLSSRLNTNLREKHAFTYGAYSSISPDKFVGSFSASASVRNEKTDSAVQEFLYEFKRLKTEAVDAMLVDTTIKQISGSFARSLESAGTIARFALNTARYNLPANYYQNYLSNLSKVNSGLVQQMANKFITPNNMYIVIVGNAKEIAKGLEKYGEVKYFDINGNETKPATSKAVDASITGESIVKKYIAAIGGDAAIAAVKDIDIKGTTKISVVPVDMVFTRKNVIGSAFFESVTAGPMLLQKRSLINGAYTQEQQGQAVPMEDKEKEGFDEELLFTNEIYYLKSNYTLKVKGIESVDGVDAYAVAVKSAKGREFTNYYSVGSGLKIKSVNIEEAEGKQLVIPIIYSDYKTFNGVQMPTKMVIEQEGMKINIAFNDIKINTGLKIEDLK